MVISFVHIFLEILVIGTLVSFSVFKSPGKVCKIDW